MNAGPELDRDHVITVCLATVPAMPRIGTTPATTSGAVSGPVAGGASDGPRLTLAYEDPVQCRRAEDALNHCGYATTTGLVNNGRLYGIQVTGWSSDRLERRSAYLREAAAGLGTDAALHETAERAIEAAAQLPLDADPRTAGYHVAVEVTKQMARTAVEEAGPFAPLTRFPSDPHLRDLLRTVQERADRMATIISDHFNVAGIAADAYLDIRHEHIGRSAGRPAGMTADGTAETAQVADLAARREARADANAFIADPFDMDLAVQAAAWARNRDPDADPATAPDFALSYARDCHGLDRARWPALEQAYQAWSEPPPAPQLAAADFPHPPDTAADATATANPEPARNPTIPRQGRAPRSP